MDPLNPKFDDPLLCCTNCKGYMIIVAHYNGKPKLFCKNSGCKFSHLYNFDEHLPITWYEETEDNYAKLRNL